MGTGCAHGFLTAMDTAWLVRNVGQKMAVPEVLSERDSAFRYSLQATPDLAFDLKDYTTDPKVR